MAAVRILESLPIGTNDRRDSGLQESAASVSRYPPDLIFATVQPRIYERLALIKHMWSLQEIKMQASAIHMYMEQHEGNRLPAIFDTLHYLRHQELTMLDDLLGPDTLREASLLFSKRTKTDVCHDTITFKDVPGLQIIVRGQLPNQAVTPGFVGGHDPRIVPIPPRAGRQPIYDVFGESTQDTEPMASGRS